VRLPFVHAITDRFIRPQLVLAGVGLGLVWGVLARLWMRLISTDPAFTWSGTLYILIAAMLLGLGVGGAAAGRRSPRRWARRVTRVFGGVSVIFLSVAAGVILVASVIPATLAVFERRWWKPVRIALFALSLLPLRVARTEIEKSGGTIKVTIATVLYLALASVIVIAWGSVVGSRRSRARGLEPERRLDRVGGVVDGGLELVG
jgi:hypothetical protein